MLLWRLSGAQHAKDGGYGLLFDGRQKTVGHAVTYGSTSPSLCVLEKLVHIEDYGYIRDSRASASTRSGWRNSPVIGVGREAWTQQKGDDWHGLGANPLLRVPSAIVPLPASPDVNFSSPSCSIRGFCEPRIDAMEWPTSFGGVR